MGKIKNEQKPLGFAMASFDVKLLFMSVPLTETIDIIFARVYNLKKYQSC